jgi:hypothetical protein
VFFAPQIDAVFSVLPNINDQIQKQMIELVRFVDPEKKVLFGGNERVALRLEMCVKSFDYLDP